MKMERVWQLQYANHDEARRDINQYIVGFYNAVRLRSTLDYLSPVAYEAQLTVKEPICLSEITRPLHANTSDPCVPVLAICHDDCLVFAIFRRMMSINGRQQR
jgi:hypothetical protein